MPEVSNHFPPDVRDAMVLASKWKEDSRIERIDSTTLEKHSQYPDLIRHPEDTSMLGAWATAKAMARGFR